MIRFTDIALATLYAQRAPNRWIVLGEDGDIWVGSYRLARRLADQAGYILVGDD